MSSRTRWNQARILVASTIGTVSISKPDGTSDEQHRRGSVVCMPHAASINVQFRPTEVRGEEAYVGFQFSLSLDDLATLFRTLKEAAEIVVTQQREALEDANAELARGSKARKP